ncbi:sugar phosphate isomerase/epimerase, partial [bacterium]|nr:sugar phosphate isomerase/epimerase [bacterium]
PDHILPNVQKLASRVDDIELLLFEADEESNLPGEPELATLNQIAARDGLTYTVHLPMDAYLGDPDETERVKSVTKVSRVLQLTQCLDPFSFNLHFEKRRVDGGAIVNFENWKRQLRRSCDDIVPQIPDSRKFAIEYLNYPLELIEDILQEYDLSVVLDLGHMILDQADYQSYLRQYLDRTSVIHLHGVSDGKDHLSLAKMQRSHLNRILGILRELNYRNVLTLEIFSKRDLEESMQVVQEIWRN